MDDTEKPEVQPEAPKRTYRTPVLSIYGDVRRLTEGGQGNLQDAGGGAGMTRMCWVAEALYGVDAPRTQLVRTWLTECHDQRRWWALAVVPLYRRFGERVAVSLRVAPFLKRCIRPAFDHAVKRAWQERANKLVGRGDFASR